MRALVPALILLLSCGKGLGPEDGLGYCRRDNDCLLGPGEAVICGDCQDRDSHGRCVRRWLPRCDLISGSCETFCAYPAPDGGDSTPVPWPGGNPK